jgi:S-adenosylmethionine:tRNA ribosyltransferase-isomerase
VLVSDFDFELPPELIAQQPPAERGSSRMLTLNRESGAWQDSWFAQLPEQLREGDVLVLNDSRVIPARLFGVRPGQEAGKIEVLLTEQLNDWDWRALTRPARRMRLGQELIFADADGIELLHATVTGSGEFGERLLRFSLVDDFFARLERLGHVPLPPYIRRALPDCLRSPARFGRSTHRRAPLYPRDPSADPCPWCSDHTPDAPCRAGDVPASAGG